MSNERKTPIVGDIEVDDAAVVEIQDAGDLRAIAVLVDRLAQDEEELRRLVLSARENGKSWGQIGIALGVTRQAAHERFSPT